MTAPLPPKIAFVLKGYPRLSETFIAQEIRALEVKGLAIELFSLRYPSDKKRHAIHQEIQAKVTYLPEYLYQEMGRVIRAWWKVRRWHTYPKIKKLFLHDWWRDRTPNRGRRFGQALVLAAELPADISQIHGHFVHTPGSVTRYAAGLRGLPYSLSAHAKDIWTIPDWEKREKLADCVFAVTCTQVNFEHLQSLADHPAKIERIYHGLDFSRFPPPVSKKSGPNGLSHDQRVEILSVGRAVAKKGYDDLLMAFTALPPQLHWHFTHIGGGKMVEELKNLARNLGLAEKITFKGSQTQADVLEALRRADLFVLASKIADDGDRDGIPNVLIEAMSQKVPCLSTHVSGIPELIQHGDTGLLARPGDVMDLAEKLATLIAQPDLRLSLGSNGYQYVCQNFSMQAGVDRLFDKFVIAKPC